MKTFLFGVTETVRYTAEIQAATPEEARKKAKEEILSGRFKWEGGCAEDWELDAVEDFEEIKKEKIK